MIGDVIGNYRVEQELGEGGMSHVYIGRTVAPNTFLPANFKVVLKIMSDELANEQTARKRFVKEADILSRLRHRYITRFYEFIPRDSGSVLIMEYVDGLPVDRLVAERGALPILEAISIAQCLLEALVYAHGKGIVHRDIKPANLIQQRNGGGVKVTDFGIAKIKESTTTVGATVLTRSGFLLGTPHYMSPEQIREPKDAGAKSDVYSTGVVLYELLTGVLPFNSRSLPKLIDTVYRGEKQAPSALRPEVDSELETIVLRSMHPDHNQRYSTAREFYEALEEYNLRPATYGLQRTGERSTAEMTAVRPGELAPPAPVKMQLVSLQRQPEEKHEISGDSILVGRDRACSIVLTHPAVSRRHARITAAGTILTLEDLKSANGTYVNNTRVEKIDLKQGDVVRFGADPSCSFVVKQRAGEA